MAERREIGQKEMELLPIIVEYAKRNGLKKEDGLAIALLCNTDDKAEEMKEFMKSNRDIDFTTLLEKAVEIHQNS